MGGDPEFVHEIDLGRTPWAVWVLVGGVTLMSGGLWLGVSLALGHPGAEPVVRLLLLAGAGAFQAFLAVLAGLVLTDGRLRAGVFRVVLTNAELRVASPPALFGRSYWGQTFTIPVARIERLVVDRYPLSGEEPSYSVHCDNGTQRCLELPQGDGGEVWPRLFTAIRRLRPGVALEDWTHTLRGRIQTSLAPGTSPSGDTSLT